MKRKVCYLTICLILTDIDENFVFMKLIKNSGQSREQCTQKIKKKYKNL